MKTLYFFSRHIPTPDQLQLAQDKGYILKWKGDLPAFEKFKDPLPFDGEDKFIAVVHPMLALEFATNPTVKKICIFENENRDGKFKAIALHEWDNYLHISEDIPF